MIFRKSDPFPKCLTNFENAVIPKYRISYQSRGAIFTGSARHKSQPDLKLLAELEEAIREITPHFGVSL
jgi:hypothetical protein